MRMLTLSAFLLVFLSCSLVPVQPSPALPTPSTPSTPSTAAQATPRPTSPFKPNRFGVFTGKGHAALTPEMIKAVKDFSSAGWVRINIPLGTAGLDYTPYLAAGVNVILMVSNQDSANIVTAYGTQQAWPDAGFPFQSRMVYQQEIRTLLQPALPFLAQGRQVWVQAENEVVDVSQNPKELYWRGTNEQYLAQLQALYEAVKSVNQGIPVVLTSFASYLEDILYQQSGAGYEQSDQHVRLLLSQKDYDAIDLHFYGCIEDIPAKIMVIKERMPPGRTYQWISTENAGPDYRCKTTPATWEQDPARFEQLQAVQLPGRLSACADHGASICLWFSIFDLKKASDLFNHFGLLDQDSSPTRQKPAYAAFKAFVAKQ